MSLLSRTVLLLLIACSLAAAQTAEDEEQAQQELEAVGAAIETIRDWLISANQTEDLNEVALRQAEQEFAELSDLAVKTQAEVASIELELSELNAETQKLALEKNKQAEIIQQLLRAAYIQRESGFLKTLFNLSDIGKVGRILHYTRKLSESQLQKVKEFESTIQRLETAEQATASKLSELNRQNAELSDQLTALDTARQNKQQALITLKASIAQKGQELEQLERNQAELQQLVEQIRIAMEGVRSFADVPPFEDFKGQLAPPLKGRIISRFGERYGEGSLTRQGVTWEAEIGTPVRAVHGGHVVFADWLRGSGLLVIVDHGDGYMSLYGSNEALSAKQGDWVDTGDILSTSGTSISTGESGVYFEVRRNGQAQNPSAWIDLNR